jgi:hypothetical protein
MAAATEQARTLVSRAVIWAGLALGTCLTVLAVRNGIRVPRLEVVLSVIATWALLTVLTVVVVELLRRHHRAIGRHAARHGKRGAVAIATHARRHGGTLRAWLVAKAAPRWENREHRHLMFLRLRGQPEGAADERFESWEELLAAEGGEGAPREDTGTGTPPAQGSSPEEGTIMTASKIAPERRARRAAARSGGSIPSEWGPVIAQTADFEPEDDGELLEWMTRQVTGLSAWAEALVDFYEHCTGVVGIDPKASAMLHDVADAAAGAAETMGAAKAKFTEHYELPREFAANGGLMTHDGRWVTGEGA